MRQAIEREVTGASPSASPGSLQAWESVIAFANGRRGLAADGAPYQGRREDAYDEREARFNHLSEWGGDFVEVGW